MVPTRAQQVSLSRVRIGSHLFAPQVALTGGGDVLNDISLISDILPTQSTGVPFKLSSNISVKAGADSVFSNHSAHTGDRGGNIGKS
eukprot:1761372-Amphidinium_carterae.1